MKKFCSNLLSLFLIIIFLCLPLSGQLLFDKSEYAARRQKLMDKIPDGIAIIIGAQTRIGSKAYFQNNDFIYFSGVEVPDAYLIIDGMKKESILFFTMSERAARNEGIQLNLIRNPEEVTGIEKVYPAEQFSSYLSRLTSQTDKFYVDFKSAEQMREYTTTKFNALLRNLTFNEWDGRLTRELQFVQNLRKRFPMVDVKDCAEMIWDLRSIKSPAEIEMIRKAGKIGVKAHIELMKATRVGIPEYELAALYKFYCEKENAQDLAYNMIICSGPNHPYVHYYEHDRILEDGDFLVVDAGPSYGYYVVDITISYPANGKFTERQKEIYRASNEMHKTCMSLYKPGLTQQELTEKANKIMREKGFDFSDDIFKIRSMQPRFGHYVGMACHDVGGSPGNGPLKPGMVFANEPYAVFPDENLGVRVEDTVVITEDGCENLTPGIPREIEEIEALMKKRGLIQLMKENSIY